MSRSHPPQGADETAVTEGLLRYADAEATDLRVAILAENVDERDRTRAVLRKLV